MEYLNFFLEGDDNNQTLRLFYKNYTVFNGVADDLVTNVNGELQMRLNFSKEERFFHTLRRSGEFILLFPKVTNSRVEIYLKLLKGIILVWPLKDLERLWEKLRYDAKEFNSIKLASSDELFLIWLISSQYNSVLSLEISSMASLVANNILAEDPEGSLSIKEIIDQLRKGKILLNSVSFIDKPDKKIVTAYINGVDGLTIEWKAISFDRDCCLIDRNLVMAISSN